MAPRTAASSPSPHNLAELDGELSYQWDDQLDHRETAKVVRAIEFSVKTGRPHPTEDFRCVSHAGAALWDCSEVERARLLVKDWRIRTESGLSRHSAEEIQEARVLNSILSARLELRSDDPQAAIAMVQHGVRVIRDAAGGDAALTSMIASGKPSRLVERYAECLAIKIPSARLFVRGRPAMRAQYLESEVERALAIIFSGDLPPKYPRIHALICQTLYAVAERPYSEGAKERLSRLHRFEQATRPSTRRGMVTSGLPDMAIASHRGDKVEELRLAREIEERLTDAELHRHVVALTERRWWPPVR